MRYVFLFVFISFIPLSYAQENTVISGKILDAEHYKEPLLMAYVALKDTKWSTRTNFNGNFELNGVTAGNYMLQIEFPGYERLELLVRVTDGERLELLKSLNAMVLPVNSSGIGDKREEILAQTADASIKE